MFDSPRASIPKGYLLLVVEPNETYTQKEDTNIILSIGYRIPVQNALARDIHCQLCSWHGALSNKDTLSGCLQRLLCGVKLACICHRHLVTPLAPPNACSDANWAPG